MPDSELPREDQLLADLAVSQGLATREAVEDCLSIIRRLAAEGVTPLPRLGELLIRKGVITPASLEQTLRRAETLAAPAPTPATRGGPAAPRRAAPPPDAARAAETPANRIGKYIRVSRLGAGGMGEVWKAWDGELDRWVALKFLKGGDGEDVARFQREAQVAGKLSHPNIAAIFEIGLGQDPPYIAMQFVEGQTLKTFPRGDRKTLVRLVRDAAAAVQFAHDQGIVHRDLKPENLMVVSRGEAHHAYVMDFGLARAAAGASDLSASGLIVGTPSYMSPEQSRGGKVDARTDVWSLGATLYDLLTERLPFKGKDVYDTLAKVQGEDPKPPRKIDATLDADLETIVLKCLEKDPARRYATASALAEDLGRWLDGEPISARPASLVYRLRKRLVKQKVPVAISAVALAAIVAGVVALALQKAEARRREDALKRLLTLATTIQEKKRDLRQLKLTPEGAVGALRKAIADVEEHIRQWPDEPQGHYIAAKGWLALGSLENAEKAARASVARAPDFRPGWSLLGIIRLEQHQERVAGSPQLARSNLEETRVLLDESSEALRQGWQEGKAQEEAQKWGLVWTSEDGVLLRLSRVFQLHYYGKDTPGALRLLHEGLGEYKAEEYLLWLGALSPPGEQLRYYDEAIESSKGYARAFLFRAGARYARRDFPATMSDLNRALELKADYAEAYSSRGVTRMEQGDLPGAIADLDQAIKLKEDFAEAYYNRGMAKGRKDELDGSIADFDQAIQRGKKYPEAYANRGATKQAKKDLAGAAADYEAALRMAPTGWNYRPAIEKLLADVRRELGR